MMDWSNESYVRLFIRDTKTWILLGWEGQCVLSLTLRKLDRAGVLPDVFNGEDLAVMLANGMPIEIVTRGLDRLLDKKVVEITDVGLVMPNYIAAQEAAMSDQQRKREQRERRLALSRIVTKTGRNVTVTSRNVPFESHSVTSGHSASQVVTLNSPSDLNSADLKIPPNPPPAPTADNPDQSNGPQRVVRDPTKPRPADPFRATFKTQCPDRLDFTEKHRGLARRGSIDINLAWSKFKANSNASGRHAVDWDAAFEAELAKSVENIERSAAYRANGSKSPRAAAVTGDRGSAGTSEPHATETRPSADSEKPRNVSGLIAGIG